jgi:glycosyltransferase involved in cell wall biosynthesis
MMARTDWVAFLDSDDLFLPKHLQRMLLHAQNTGADFVYSWFKILQDLGGGNRRVLEDDPIFPMTGLGFHLPKDNTGAYALVSATAFVNEPDPGGS